jgi:hypothetical protein
MILTEMQEFRAEHVKGRCIICEEPTTLAKGAAKHYELTCSDDCWKEYARIYNRCWKTERRMKLKECR